LNLTDLLLFLCSCQAEKEQIMSWNNARETNKFRNEQRRLIEMYIKNGMTEEQIEEMYLYDKEEFNRERNINEHMNFVFIDPIVSEESNGDVSLEQILSPYYDEYNPFEFGFKCEKLNMLTDILKGIDFEIFRLLFEEYKQVEIANLLGVDQSTISRKIANIKNIFPKL